MMMCQCRFIKYNKCTPLVGEVDNGRRYACVGTKTVLKKGFFFKITYYLFVNKQLFVKLLVWCLLPYFFLNKVLIKEKEF